MAVLAVTN